MFETRIRTIRRTLSCSFLGGGGGDGARSYIASRKRGLLFEAVVEATRAQVLSSALPADKSALFFPLVFR